MPSLKFRDKRKFFLGFPKNYLLVFFLLFPKVFADVAILGGGSAWVEGTTHTAEAGTSRAFLVFLYAEHSASTSATAVTYGGQPMTLVVGRDHSNGAFYSYTSAWILNEAGISAATSSTISVTWSATPSTGSVIQSVFLSGVTQGTQFNSTQSAVQTNTGGSLTLTTSALTNNSGDMAFLASTLDRNRTYTLNNSFNEAWEYTGGLSIDGVVGYKATTGSSETPSVTADSVLRITLIGFVIKNSTRTWNGGGGSSTWTTDANWGGLPNPDGGEDVYFGGTTELSVNHNVTAGTSYNSITFNSGSGAFTISGNSITLGGSVTNNDADSQSISLNMALSGNRTLNAASGNLVLSGVVSGSYGITKSGSNILKLKGSNTYTGATTISAGTAQAGVITSAFGSNSAVTLANVSGAILDLNGYNNTIGSLAGGGGTGGNVSLGSGTLTTGGDNTSTSYAGVISGTGGVTKSGSGALTLSGANTFSGGFSLSAGTLNINNAAALGATAGTFTIANGTTIDNTSGGSITNSNNNPITVNGDFTFTGSNALNLGTGTVAMGGSARAFTVSASTLTLGGTVTGTGGLTKNGNGTLYLNSTSGSQWSGTTTINGGTLQLGSPGNDNYYSLTWNIAPGATLLQTTLNVIYNGSSINIDSGGTYNMNSTTETFQYISGRGSITNSNSSLNLFMGGSGAGQEFSGVISGSGALNLGQWDGSESLTLSGLNTYTGKTSLRGSTIIINTIKDVSGGSSSIGAPTSVANGTIDIGYTTTTGKLVYTGSAQNTNRVINLAGSTGGATINQSGTGLLKFTSALTAASGGAKTLTLQGSTAGTGEIAGAIVNNSSVNTTALTKSGTGTWTLSGTNTYTGATTISAGILLVTGTIASGSAVSVTGTLGGGTWASAGTVAGTITVNNTGTIAPGIGGTTIGKLSTGAVTFNTTSTYSVDLDGTTPTNDQINSSGTVALGSAVNTLTVASLSNSANGKIYTIISGTSVTGTFSGKADGATFTASGRTLRINYTSTTVTLTDVSPTWSATGLGVITGGAIRDSAIYIGSESDTLYKINTSTGARVWTYDASAYGNVSTPSYAWNSSTSKYDVFFTAGNYFIGVQDNGTTKTDLFAVNIAEPTGPPYVEGDDNYVYFASTDNIHKRSKTTGANAGGSWPITATNVSLVATPVIMFDEIHFATTDGYVKKYDMSGTLQNSYNCNCTLTLPLHMSGNNLILAPTNKDSLIALNRSNYNRNWGFDLDANNTGPVFSLFGIDTFYVATGTLVQKIGVSGSTATRAFQYTAAVTINSGPIMPDSRIWFGGASGYVYQLSNATGSAISGYPLVYLTGDVKHGPWVDDTYNRVLGGTTTGELGAFDR